MSGASTRIEGIRTRSGGDGGSAAAADARPERGSAEAACAADGWGGACVRGAIAAAATRRCTGRRTVIAPMTELSVSCRGACRAAYSGPAAGAVGASRPASSARQSIVPLGVGGPVPASPLRVREGQAGPEREGAAVPVDSGGCPSDPVASRPAMQEPGTARGGDGQGRHSRRGLHGVGAKCAADPRLHVSPRGRTCCSRAAAVEVMRDHQVARHPLVLRPGTAGTRALGDDLVGAGLGRRRHLEPTGRGLSPSSGVAGASVNVPAPTALASPEAVPPLPHAAVFTVTVSPGMTVDGRTSRPPPAASAAALAGGASRPADATASAAVVSRRALRIVLAPPRDLQRARPAAPPGAAASVEPRSTEVSGSRLRTPPEGMSERRQ